MSIRDRSMNSSSSVTTSATHSASKDRKSTLLVPTESERMILTKILDTEFTCSICLEIMRKPSKLDCHHMFCFECLVDWLHCNRTCPMCRTSKIGKTPVKCEFVEKLILQMASATTPSASRRQAVSKNNEQPSPKNLRKFKPQEHNRRPPWRL